RRQRRNAKSGGRRARHPYRLGLLIEDAQSARDTGGDHTLASTQCSDTEPHGPVGAGAGSTARSAMQSAEVTLDPVFKYVAAWDLMQTSSQANSAPPGTFALLARTLMHGQLRDLTAGMRSQLDDGNSSAYGLWVRRFDTLDAADINAIRGHMAALAWQPLISVIMPVHDPHPAYLEQAVESIMAQLYGKWELCVVDDASDSSAVKTLLRDYAGRDQRIKVAFRAENGHISAASNDALSMATGDYVAFMDHDDVLPCHALYRVAVEAERWPDAVLIYSDEDKINDRGQRSDPYFKPDWNPEMMCGQNMVNHLAVFRKNIVDESGGLRIGYEGAQDWDLVMRVAERVDTSRIRHIPEILYHWRTAQEHGTGRVSASSYPVQAGRKVIKEHLARTGIDAKVVPARLPMYNRVAFGLPPSPPRVSFVIPTRDNPSLLEKCVDSITSARYSGEKEVIICNNQSIGNSIKALFRNLSRRGFKVIDCDFPFNHSRLNNIGVSHATGDVIVLMNDDIWSPDHHWLEELIAQALRPDVGAAGVALFYPSKVMQHGGVLLGFGGMHVAGNAQIGVAEGDAGYWGKAVLTQDLSGVTAACMALRKEVWNEVGGFDEAFPHHYNDVDFCIRIVDAGFRIIWTPYARLYHEESASRGYADRSAKMLEWQASAAAMQVKWGSRLASDPFHNPNLSSEHDSQALAWPPRTEYPWHSWSTGTRGARGMHSLQGGQGGQGGQGVRNAEEPS
ncbi:MAG: glycosyltransferase family 2 protein, partial [Acidimicrobiales bacterium]